MTIARSQPVAFGGIVTRTTNVALLPEVRFPVSGTPSESVSGRGAVPSAVRRSADQDDANVTSNVSFTLVPVFLAVRLYQTVSPEAPFSEAVLGERAIPIGPGSTARFKSP